MAIQKLIILQDLCSHYEIEMSFLNELHATGLIEIKTINQQQCIDSDSITDLEKMIRLHNDLHINTEGIDVVFNLLQRVDALQTELQAVKNRLGIYEDKS